VRLVDLSAPIRQSPGDLPDVLRTDIEFMDHAQGAAQIEALLGVPARLLREREGWATETFTRFGTHNSTHVDAPWHYNSRIGGEPAETIDSLPLDWFFGPGVVLDMTTKEEGEAIDVPDVEAELERIGHQLGERDIVLVHTGRDRFVDEPEYIALGPGVTVGATLWLYERGVRVMGIDAWGWDGPLHIQAQAALERDEPGIFWAAHQADISYSQIERLVNLGELPPTGFQVACFPLKIMGAGAAPARVVGIVPG
jgi:kynurenine formamidase